MSWVAAAIVGGAVIGAVGSNMAANKGQSSANKAVDTQAGMFNTIVGQEQPFIQAGYGATTRLNTLLGTGGDPNAAGYGSLTSNFTPQDFLNNLDPGYQFQLQTGGQAIRNADTPGVGALSGPALKDLMSFNQGMAATGYQNAFNRFTTQQNNIFSRLSAIAGMGQNAASNTGTAGTALGQGMANAQLTGGAYGAAGTMGAFNALGGGANTLAGLMYLNANNPGVGINSYGGYTPSTSGIDTSLTGPLFPSGT